MIDIMEHRMQTEPVLGDVLRMTNDELRETHFGRLFGHYAAFDACADSIRSVAGRIYLPKLLEFPGRSIDELVGKVTEIRLPSGGSSVPAPHGLVYLWDHREGSPNAAHHDRETGEWVCYYADPHPDVRRCMDQGMGSWGLEIIHRKGNDEAPASTLLVARWSSSIGSRWLTLEVEAR